MCSITMHAMTNDYNGGQPWDQKSTINYHQGQKLHHWSLMGELAKKTRPGSTGTVHTMGGGGWPARIRGSKKVHCHEGGEHAAMLAGSPLPMSDIPKRQSNALRHWRHWRWLESNVAMRWQSMLQCWWWWLSRTSNIITRRPNMLRRRRN